MPQILGAKHSGEGGVRGILVGNVVSKPSAELGDKQVLLRVRAVSLQFRDLAIAKAAKREYLAATPPPPPRRHRCHAATAASPPPPPRCHRRLATAAAAAAASLLAPKGQAQELVPSQVRAVLGRMCGRSGRRVTGDEGARWGPRVPHLRSGAWKRRAIAPLRCPVKTTPSI